MADQNNSRQTCNRDSFALKTLKPNTATDKLATQNQEKGRIPKSETLPAEITHDSTERKTTESTGKTLPKTTTKIPVRSSGKPATKSTDTSDTKGSKSTAKVQHENSSQIGEKSPEIGHDNSEIGHNRSKTEPFIPRIQENDALKSRETLENELLAKTNEVEMLKGQLDGLKQVKSPSIQPQQKVSTDNELNFATKSQPDGTTFESEDLERKVKFLSEENYELRERLLKKEVEIEKLKIEETKTQENIVNKVLKKENSELHHENEQLKLERDKLRHLVNERQSKAEKLVAGLKDMEEQLLQAKRALEDRTKASTRLQNRLAKIDSELNQYRERYGNLERQTKKSPSSRSRSLSPGERGRLGSTKDQNEKQITLLQQREAKLVGDRRQLETSVNILTNKIAELEDKLKKSQWEKRPTHERGSQTYLGTGDQLTSTMIQGLAQGTQDHGSERQRGETVRKCRAIVESLGKFFDEFIQDNQDVSIGGSKSRRNTVAARRANELLHELSMSMEHALSTKSNEREPFRADRSTSPARRSTAMNAEASRTIWDKLCDEVAQHEFTFDPLSPPLQTEGSAGMTDDKQQEVKRAERGLQRMYGGKGEVNSQGLTKEDATRMMDVSRKQTESVVKELLRKHQGEIRSLVENACQSSPVPTVAFDITNPGISGQDEATMAVKELDCFKSRSTKVQSLILKLQEIVERAKKDKDNAEQKLQNLTEEIRQKDTLLQARGLELRRRHGKALETEKALQGEISTFKNEKAAILKENARLHELCRQKDLQILQRVQDIKAIHQQVNEREMTHKQNLANMRKKVEEAWGLYESVKTRAEKRTAEFSEAAEKLKASQGYLLDLWQTLKTVDNVVEANEQDEL